MANLKTSRNDADVKDFLNAVEDSTRRSDSFRLLELMKDITREEPEMWGGGSIVGFGSYHYKYQSGREGDWFLTGFSPRKQNMSLYIMTGFDRFKELLEKLGPYKTGKSCLYIKKLDNIDLEILGEMISESVQAMRKKYRG